jgi:hypothetical protein
MNHISKLIVLFSVFIFLHFNDVKLSANNQLSFNNYQVQPTPKNKKTTKKSVPLKPNDGILINADSVNTTTPALIEGVMISYGEFISETSKFKDKYPNENFGGVIGKEKLQSLLYIMNPDVEWVNFYFGESVEMKKFVIFLPSDLKSDGYIVRNSVFCPEYCTDNQLIVNVVADDINQPVIDTIEKPIILIPEGEFMPFGMFQGEVSSYRGKNPNQTYGGIFGKNFLQNFLNSISPDIKTINFYFAETPDLKRYIILIPSGLTSDGYIIKNMEFCPDNCKDNQ